MVKTSYDRGFSLVEIVLALAVVSFALVGIMGLFPVALKSAQESQRETRAAHIAQQIFNDLQSCSITNTFIAIGTNITLDTDRTTLNLAAVGDYKVSYNSEGLPLGAGSVNGSVYAADIAIRPNVPKTGIIRIQTSVSAPAEAATNRRSTYNFVTYMNL